MCMPTNNCRPLICSFDLTNLLGVSTNTTLVPLLLSICKMFDDMYTVSSLSNNCNQTRREGVSEYKKIKRQMMNNQVTYALQSTIYINNTCFFVLIVIHFRTNLSVLWG